MTDSKAKWADQWFEDLDRLVHPLIEKDRKDRQKPVRVALLDTGVDARHPLFRKALQENQIRSCRGFPNSLDPLSDRNGHGTHGASVFMRTAPRAELYIARIADDTGNIAAENNYASVVEALDWCKQNKVDVISMSLGMREEPSSVVDALVEAKNRGTIILASSSNEGANQTIAFPARLPDVICIGSADGKGGRSSFSPPFIGEEKYSALGEAVRGACPLENEGEAATESYSRRTGTSTAVVIAAAIVAFLIDYTRQFTERGRGADNWENLRKILLKMSEATAEEPYRYLSPKYLFTASKDVKSLIKSVLRKPAVLDKRWTAAGNWKSKADDDPLWLVHASIEPSHKFVDRRAVTCNHVWERLQHVNRVVISGLPGVGKTELASQIVWNARESRKCYTAIFWLNAASTTSFQSGIQDMARVLKLVDETRLASITADDIRDMVLQELNRNDHWLLVLDNLDEASLLEDFLPERRESRHVLITTRHRTLSSALKAEQIDLNPMEQDEALSLFTKSANRLQKQSGHSESQLLELVNALGCLPLAIVQAAAYLSETQDDVSSYYQFYKSSRKDIWGWKPLQDSSYITVATVMAISFGKVKESPVSVRLFCLLSFLDPANVPETLWTTSDKFQDPLLRTAFSNPVKTVSALQPLLVYNFVQRSGGSIAMHRLVQDVMRDLIEHELQDQANVLDVLDDLDRTPAYWVQRAVELISIAYPSSSPNTWTRCELYNSNANCCIMYGNKYELGSEMFADLQRAVGKYAYDQGGYAQARELFESSLQIYERECGEDRVKTADALSDFGRSLAQLGEHRQAIQQYEAALKVNDINFAKTPIDSACIIRDIGKSLFGLGKYEEAIQSFERALKITENTVAADQLLSANIIASIGAVLLSQQQFKKALKKCELALEIQEHILGRDHINSAGLVCLLGVILHRKGRYRKALRQYERALKIYTIAFGEGHIKSADTLDAIGLSYLHLGRCHEALERFKQVRSITENAFGKEHIKTEGAVFNMGASYLFLGMRDEALEQYELAMKIYAAKLCEDHQEEGLCITTDQFVQRHSAVEQGEIINPLVENHLKSIKLLRRLRLACSGKGLQGRLYLLVVKLLPLGVKLYGKYNEIEVIAVPGVYEFVEPSLYGL